VQYLFHKTKISNGPRAPLAEHAGRHSPHTQLFYRNLSWGFGRYRSFPHLAGDGRLLAGHSSGLGQAFSPTLSLAAQIGNSGEGSSKCTGASSVMMAARAYPTKAMKVKHTKIKHPNY
jgi:hypothetical protein